MANKRVLKAVKAKFRAKKKARKRKTRTVWKAKKKDKRAKKKSDKAFGKTAVSKAAQAERKTNRNIYKNKSVFFGRTEEGRRKAGIRSDATAKETSAYKEWETKRKG